MPESKNKNPLFAEAEKTQLLSNAPLAARMRPKTLEHFAGQTAFLAPDKLLYRMIAAKTISSLIFYGPAGTGKTSLALIISNELNADFHHISAPAAGVAEIREILNQAKNNLLAKNRKTVLFIDEIHRFSRSQQDVLLADVESGIVLLIGATTENPYFSVNSPLLSRSTIFEFKPLDKSDILGLLKRALKDSKNGFGHLDITASEAALEYIAIMSDGDARRA